MAWCPKCKLEYREGITACTDCGGELVEHLEEEVVYESIMTCENEELADKFLKFLVYSNVMSGVREYKEETKEYSVKVDIKDKKEALKLFKAFYSAETEEDSPKDTKDSEEQKQTEDADSVKETAAPVVPRIKASDTPVNLREHSKVYVKQRDKYQDLSSSSKIFYIFGVIGLVYVGLNAIGVLSLIYGAFSYTAYTVLFAACLIVGYTTQKSASQTKAQISEEEDLTEKINQWLHDNIRESTFSAADEEGASEEANYLNRTNYIRELLNTQFEGLDDSYADQLIEEFYTENFH